MDKECTYSIPLTFITVCIQNYSLKNVEIHLMDNQIRKSCKLGKAVELSSLLQ